MKAINADYITQSTKIVFNYALPVLVFQKMLHIEGFSDEIVVGVALFLGMTVLVMILTWFLMARCVPAIRGSVVQGAFRGNLAILGLAVVQNLFGVLEIGYMVVLIAVTMPTYNLLAIIVLGHDAQRSWLGTLKSTGINLIRNPLVWGIGGGSLCNLLNITFPKPVIDSLANFSSLTLPLALIGIGGSLQLKSLIHGAKYWSVSAFMKLILLPGGILLAGHALSLDTALLRVVVLAGAGPTAFSSYVMAEGFGADVRLAGEIVTITTLISAASITLWAMILL